MGSGEWLPGWVRSLKNLKFGDKKIRNHGEDHIDGPMLAGTQHLDLYLKSRCTRAPPLQVWHQIIGGQDVLRMLASLSL